MGWLAESRSFFHASMQVQGFLACFVVGFLMTALPRFLGAAPARLKEVAYAVTAVLLFAAFSLKLKEAAAQAAFLSLMGFTLLFAVRRLPARTKLPPASFVLVALGLGHAVLV